MPEERKEKLVNDVLALMDTDGDRTISRDEFHRYMKTGKTLPDYGYGPGHHGDDEYEYEIHHFEE